jgi:hypothetical protein
LSKIVTGLMVIILCGVLFEAGVVLSDVIVTGQPPHINKLLTSQLNAISSLISSIHHGSNKQKTVTLLNPDDVISALQNKTGLNGINIQTLSAYTNDSTSNAQINVTLTVLGYNTTTSGTNVTNGSIIISPNQTYNITATATGQTGDGGYMIDVNSIMITNLIELNNNNGNTN